MNQLDRFPASPNDAGIDNFNTEFSPELKLKKESKNVSTGINQGLGPRYGISPMPGHTNKDFDDVFEPDGLGLRTSENDRGDFATAPNLRFVNRTKFLGIHPLSIGRYDDLKIKGKMFLWLLGDNNGGGIANTDTKLSAVANCENVNLVQDRFRYKQDASIGFGNNLWGQVKAPSTGSELYDWVALQARRFETGLQPFTASIGTTQDFMQKKLTVDDDLYHVSSTSIAVSGKNFGMQWTCGRKITDGSATVTAEANYLAATRLITLPDFVDLTGIPSSWNVGNFRTVSRTLTFWNLTDASPTAGSTRMSLMYKYTYVNHIVDDTVLLPTFNQKTDTANTAMTGTPAVTPNDRGEAYAAADIGNVLMNDQLGFTDSSYKAVLVAAKKPFAFVVQEWERAHEGQNVQIVPLNNKRIVPREIGTQGGSSSVYTEDTVRKTTCINSWPQYDSAVPLVDEAALATVFPVNDHIGLGAANTGVLRANTRYEFTYSIFDKQLGTETNVGTPVKFLTGSNDFVRLSLYKDAFAAAVWEERVPNDNSDLVVSTDIWEVRDLGSVDTSAIQSSFSELRFYYRALGTYEWLPALFIDATKLFYYPEFKTLWACEGTAVGLPGGQPGGFIDHSELPDDEYFCVVNFRQRAFWISEKNMVFSPQNNLFEYPLRNSVSAPTGGFRGAIIHTLRGETDQRSKIVVFGAEETYVGVFTGQRSTQPVVVSPTTTASYEVDGSDFVLDTWTSVTAFSYRAAIVADGILYWWGEQGVYMDDGIGNPTKTSRGLEPDIFKYYDVSMTDEIHTVYDEHTQEITWFYPPREDNTITHGLILNVITGQFFHYEWDMKIDWAKRTNMSNKDISVETNNLRTVISARKDNTETVQRGYYMDHFNRSGDMNPETEFLVKEIAAGSVTLEKVLTLDSGYNVTNFNTIAVNDIIVIEQFKDYTNEATGNDFMARVVSTDQATDKITILLPDGAILPVVDIANHRNYFPIWHAAADGAGLNGIDWEVQSKYWVPGGSNYFGIWQWLYMFFKYVKYHRTDKNTFELTYRTPSGGDYVGETIELVDNSDGNCQVYHSLQEGQLNNQGQAIKIKLTGNHIADKWALQLLDLYGVNEGGDQLRQYQG